MSDILKSGGDSQDGDIIYKTVLTCETNLGVRVQSYDTNSHISMKSNNMKWLLCLQHTEKRRTPKTYLK